MNNMNQMMGNMNMNPMGMNNQLMTNFGMDETAMKLKAIIAPYEQKISELEKIIKEKDFEILLLKEKLNNYNNNQFNKNNQIPIMNPINMDLNNNPMFPMNPMNMNNFQNWQLQYNIMNNNNNLNFGVPNLNNQKMSEGEKIQINFRFGENKIYKESCDMNEKIKKVLKRFCQKYGINFKEHKFVANGKKLYNHLTVAESGLINNSYVSIIKVGFSEQKDNENTDSDEEIYSIKFRNTFGKINLIRGNPENSIGTIIKKYLRRIGRADLAFYKGNLENEMVFIYNAQKIQIDNKTKLKKLFNIDRQPSITVNDVHSIIAV